MNEKNSFWKIPIVFFITRLFILGGMVLIFGSVAYSIAVLTIPTLFNLDINTNPTLLSQFNNPTVIYALKYIQVCSSIGMFILPAWHFGKALNKIPQNYLSLNKAPDYKEAITASAALLIYLPFIAWLAYANEKIQMPPMFQQWEAALKATEELTGKLTQTFLKAENLRDLGVNLFVIAILPAISEELFFRGALQNFIKLVSKNKHLAVWITALVFSAIHGQFYGFIPRLILGAVLGYVYVYSGSIWIPIIMHFVNNGFAVVCSYTPFKEKLPLFLQDGYVFEEWYINTGSAILGSLLIFVIYLLSRKRILYNGE